MISPAGWEHGQVAGVVQILLGHFIRKNRLGRVFAAETGFLLRRNPDTVRAPDFAFIANESIPPSDPVEAYWPGAPDLAVEVLSPGDTVREIDEKIEDWLAAGCKAVWVIDPKLQTITIYQSKTDVQLLTFDDTLRDFPLIPGFSAQVGDFFKL